MPQFVSVQLVKISTISLGLMNGGDIELVIGIIKTNKHNWGGTTLNVFPYISFRDFVIGINYHGILGKMQCFFFLM